MRVKSFHGGVHPPENKHRTESKAIEALPIPKKLVIPMQQHTGAPCDPLVKEGDEVKAGQKIGESKAAVSAAVHSGICGRVTAVARLPHPSIGRPVLSVVVEGEGDPGSWTSVADWKSMDVPEIRRRIQEAGVVGMGGAAFPTHVKLSPPPDKKVEALILNGVECEPYLTCDHRLMVERGADILEGARILMKVLGIQRAYLGIEGNKPDAIRLMTDLCRKGSLPVEVVPLKVKYPQGAEKQLIKSILNREVPSGGLPIDVGAVVQNVGTALAVYEAVALSKPLIERVLTVSGDGVKEARNLRVRIGTLFSEVLAACGTVAGADVKVLMGGPMMGLAQYTTDVPVVKGTSGILVLSKGAHQEKDTTCIKCGRCVEICPMGLMPNRIADYAEKDNFAMTEKFDVRDCIECGACGYICDAKRPMVHLIKYAKLNLAKPAKKA